MSADMDNNPTVARDSSQEDLSTHEGNSKWLDAHQDPVASLYTFSSCMTFADINGDGENKLVIADLGTGTYNMKLKVYKGTSLMSENAIIDLPTGVCTFFMDNNEPRVPAIGVASGPYVYVYKNLRPYFKFTLPALDVNPVEQDLWSQAKEDKIDVTVLREMLDSIRREGNEGALTVRSLRFLNLQDREQMESFAQVHKQAPLKRQTVITCIDTLKKTTADEDAISCLVVGTESKQIFALDPEAFTILSRMEVPSVPVFLSVTGLYDVEFRIVISCRNGNIYTLKRGMKTARLCVELNAQPVGLQRVGKNIVVGCMDQTVQCYTTKGKKLWTIYLPSSINTMEIMDHKQKGFKAVMVALNNGEVHFYRDKYLINTIKTNDVITGLKYGRFGREDSTLVMSTRRGGLLVKILKRSSQFEDKDLVRGPPATQNQKLNVPKKTKVFVDQTMRERENGVSMHRMFQHDLYRLRLNTARAFVKALDTSMTPISSNPQEPLKLSAQIQGIGPTFKLTVGLQNTSLNLPSMNLLISFLYDEKLYSLQKTMIQVPMLVPGLNYSYETLVECLSDKGISDVIKVFVLKEGRSVPIITAVINMPVSETIVVV
ncbi:BBSome complex member BBS1-like isoform X2 [Amphiura filiformis]|uniref:BBSome complex member BBS1-like isoform X2 n=1 Tax=Amphiura filiformis TaxID=82378 RepID=UPI003B220E7E